MSIRATMRRIEIATSSPSPAARFKRRAISRELKGDDELKSG